MKNIFKLLSVSIILFSTLLSGQSATAQLYGHEWIKPNNQYYKFKINTDNIYRITKSKLDELGFGNVPGSNFAIFREGKEIPIYVTTNGVLGANDYIEFAGFKADGKMDTALFANPSDKVNLRHNILGNNAYYFLTHDNSQHERLTLTNNVIPPNAIPAPYIWRETFLADNPPFYFYGSSASNSEPYYSSKFNKAQGYTYTSPYQTNQSFQFSAYNRVVGFGPDTITYASVNSSRGVPVNAKFYVGGQEYINTTVQANSIYKNTFLFSAPGEIFNVSFIEDAAHLPIDVKIKYHGNLTVGSFTYPNSYGILPNNENYLDIKTFDWTPTNKADVINFTSKTIHQVPFDNYNCRVYFNVANKPHEFFMTKDTYIGRIDTFVKFTPTNILDFSGNYIILSNNKLINSSPSYVKQFEDYRKSNTGGNYQVITVSVEDIYNHFGYGFEYHPLAIKKFIKYALDNWSTKPEYLFIIGKGMNYSDYLSSYLRNKQNYTSEPIPTWGYPGTDNLFSSFATNGRNFPELATGRLSVITNEEINIYLTKVKEYEAASKSIPSIEESLWKKRALHIAGAGNLSLQNSLIAALDNAKNILEDTLINANVRTVYKRDTDPVSTIVDNNIDSMITSGLRYITFYGHASSSGFDYNLNSPEFQKSKPNYPIFQAYGCDVSSIFTANEAKTIAEKYILSTTGGSIAMIASNNLGWTNVLPTYMLNFYKELSFKNYEKTLGKQYQSNIHLLNTIYANNEFFDIHTQSLLLQGDPGLILHNPDLPDYAIESKNVATYPAAITSNLTSFKVNAKIYNIGKASKDSVWVRVKQLPTNNNSVNYIDSTYISVGLVDSVIFEIPLYSQRSIGVNKYEIEVDPQNEITELFETNNKTTIEIYINSEDLVPVYPYNYSIVNNNNITLKASTLNSFAALRNYTLEIDTTKLFNSAIKQSHRVSSIGGVITWKPTITYQDSTVYYWRTSADTIINGSLNWNYSSFIYINNGQTGWNQSHYFQYLEDSLSGLGLPNRQFEFAPIQYEYVSHNKHVFSNTINNQRDVEDIFNGSLLNTSSCGNGRSIQIGIFDSISGLPIGRTLPCSRVTIQSMNEFNVFQLASRNAARDFLQNIPPGHYVTIKNLIFTANYAAIENPQSWKQDSVWNNSNNTLYNTLIDLGFSEIENMNPNLAQTFVFFTKKGDPNYIPKQVVSQADEKISLNVTLFSKPDTGALISPVIGPAKNWESLHWKQSALDNIPQNDSSFVKVFGISNNNAEILLHEGYTRDTLLNFIDASQYPNIRLVWNSVDNINRSSADLDFWRVHYTPQPEAALNKIKLFSFTDTLGFGQNLNLRLAIENISEYDMDSMLVRYRLIDNNNVTHDLGTKRFRSLPAGDTLIATLDADLRSYSGNNTLFIEANPNKDQPEQYHPNNIGYLPFNIGIDNRNPLLDVTFDGIRILDKDLVSGKPFIKILLNDENKNLLLNDTALFEVMLASPNGGSGQGTTPVRIPIDGTLCKFYPALPGQSQNEAYIEYRPTLEMDGLYKLIVRAKDNSNNSAGNFDRYEVNFMVENKSSITHLLNYPNPFSTSTAFVFTLTGSQIPSQFKIQIISVTGKVVREITKEELGPIHIGRNITEYKWDGKDQYGQMLGNGVYLYRVITHTNGETIEHRSNASVDKYFKNGYGKMYIMR